MEVLILDFGSQFTQLIARRFRELHVYCEIFSGELSVTKIKSLRPKGIVLSGGPYSTLDPRGPKGEAEILNLGIPVLGICYGMQWMAHSLGARVESRSREYGSMNVGLSHPSSLFKGLPKKFRTWMSHGDEVLKLPPSFLEIAKSEEGGLAAMEDPRRKLFAVQFHPEVTHTEGGQTILSNFLEIAGAQKNWNVESFAQTKVKEVANLIGEGHAICALSGGVDSCVAATLVEKAIPGRLDCFYIDTGLQREGESQQIMENFATLGLRVEQINAQEEFLSALQNISDPEKKRKAIGHTFIEIFDREARHLVANCGRKEPIKWMVQGTLYPDVIESLPPPGQGGFSSTIKSHHNVGGLPKDMPMKLVEPLQKLFKDEVRRLGASLGISKAILNRHPFPGPGLAIRCLGEVTKERLRILRAADHIYINTLRKRGLYDEIWQAGAILLPVSTVGVMGDKRTYENPIVLRAVTSDDGMTANWYPFPAEVLNEIAARIINEIKGVNRVVYDISSKPPATIEWE